MPQDATYTPYRGDLNNLFRAAELAARLKMGGLSEVESIELQQWLEESPNHLIWLENAVEEESLSSRLEDLARYEATSDIAFQKVRAALDIAPPEEERSFGWRWLGALFRRRRG